MSTKVIQFDQPRYWVKPGHMQDMFFVMKEGFIHKIFYKQQKARDVALALNTRLRTAFTYKRIPNGRPE